MIDLIQVVRDTWKQNAELTEANRVLTLRAYTLEEENISLRSQLDLLD